MTDFQRVTVVGSYELRARVEVLVHGAWARFELRDSELELRREPKDDAVRP